MVEGGPPSRPLLAADLIDEAVLLRGPNLIGADGIDPLEAAVTARRSGRGCLAGHRDCREDTVENLREKLKCSPASSPISAR
jgi:riboflavin biosynthesis pyrimidine reductase